MDVGSKAKDTWLVILALLIFPPLGLYWMWQSSRYDRWFPGLLLLIGLPLLATILIQVTVVRPQINALYSEFNAGGPSQLYYVLPVSLLAGMALIQIGYGIYLLRWLNKGLALPVRYKTGVVGLLFANWVLGGVLQGLSLLSLVVPLYNLTSSF